jgi:hypothetical protein
MAFHQNGGLAVFGEHVRDAIQLLQAALLQLGGIEVEEKILLERGLK